VLQVPLEIAYHHVDASPWIEETIRARVAKLEKIYDRLVSCRVRIDRRAVNPTLKIPPVVRIEMGVPGHGELVVSHEPDRLMRKFRAPDLRNAINEAFRLAEDQLAAFKEQLKDHGKEHGQEGRAPQHGQVAEITPDNDSGFILTETGNLLYFHRNNLIDGDFDGLRRGQDVDYVEEAGDGGPTAMRVRSAA
jgi:cold shock CspA family protein/ribosome-associated translation inhibitor RaiA